VLLLVALALGNHVVQPGTYRQCDINTGDETILEVGTPTDAIYPTRLTFRFDGCRTDNIQYTVNAEYDWVFIGEGRPEANGATYTEYRYSSATAVPQTQEAVTALRNSCPSRTFSIGQTTDVLGCLFCATRYDIYFGTDPGNTFVLGDGFACTEEERPLQFEESLFVLNSASPSSAPSGVVPSASRTPAPQAPSASRTRAPQGASATRTPFVPNPPQEGPAPNPPAQFSSTPSRTSFPSRTAVAAQDDDDDNVVIVDDFDSPANILMASFVIIFCTAIALI